MKKSCFNTDNFKKIKHYFNNYCGGCVYSLTIYDHTQLEYFCIHKKLRHVAPVSNSTEEGQLILAFNNKGGTKVKRKTVTKCKFNGLKIA